MNLLFPIPLDVKEALRSGLYCCGTTGSGKSDIGMYAAKRLMQEGVIVVVFDPTQDWMKRSTIPEYQKWDNANFWEDQLPQKSTIYDISELSPKQQQAMVEYFCKFIMKQQAKDNDLCEDKYFFNDCEGCPFANSLGECQLFDQPHRKRYFIIFEEAHTYFPQGCMTAKRYQNTVKMMTQGRNFKVRFMCITQFSSMIDKKAMRYMKQRYFGATDEPNDVEYVSSFFPKKAFGEYTREVVETMLPNLAAGYFIYKHGKQAKVIVIEPFATDDSPKQIIPQQPDAATSETERLRRQAERLQRGRSKAGKSLASLIIAFLWFIAIIAAVLHRP